MCGINGVFGLDKIAKPKQLIQCMNEALAHRGPDAEGCFVNDQVALGHRRLSIIDTSKKSNQPLFSKDHSITLVFNGELYNYVELKEELREFQFETSSDTEVLIAAYQKWGISCMEKFNGMFGFALWDDNQKALYIARDRIGIKPIYFYESDTHLVFSSEIRAMLKSGLVEKKLDKSALADYLRYQTVHGPRTIVQGIRLLPAGHFLKINQEETTLHEYWNLISEQTKRTYEPTREALHSRTKDLLHDSIRLRMRSDVPYGAFLSGGIDSSAIVGLMAEHTSHPVSTFNISFKENEFSEAKYARMVAKKFNTKHEEITLTSDTFKNLIPDALDAMDHPSGDGPNTFVVSKATKEAGVTMALSGLGGDELFAGYAIFTQSLSLMNKRWLSSFSPALRGLVGKLYKTLKPSISSDKIAGILAEDYIELPYIYPWSRTLYSDDVIAKVLTRKKLPENAVKSKLLELLDFKEGAGIMPSLSQVSLAEINTYMSHVLLRDSDQMSMAHALEVRVPFLDHRLVEHALRIPDTLKYPSAPKKFLIDALGDLLPSDIVDRPKMGFTLPWNIWMKSDLKSFCENHLKSLGKRAEFNENQIDSLWKGFLNNDPKLSWSRLWPLVVLGHWIEKNGIE